MHTQADVLWYSCVDDVNSPLIMQMKETREELSSFPIYFNVSQQTSKLLLLHFKKHAFEIDKGNLHPEFISVAVIIFYRTPF